MRQRTLILAVIIFLLLLGGGYFYWRTSIQPFQRAPQYTWVSVTRSDLTQSWRENGVVTSEHMAELAFPLTGKVTAVVVQSGDTVEKGALLARLDAAEAVANWRASLAEVNIARANRALAQGAHTVKSAQREVQNETVHAAKFTASAQAAVVAKTRLVAPFSGVILRETAAPGEVATAGVAVMTLADPANLRLTVPLAQTILSDVRIGTPVEITLDALGSNKNETGHIERVELVPSTLVPVESLTQPEEKYQAVIVLDDTTDLKVGMTGNASFSFPIIEGALSVPKGALFTEGDRHFVLVATSAGQVEKREVQTGVETNTAVEITAGLSFGDHVAIF